MVIAYTNSMLNETNNKGENKMSKLTEADYALLRARGKVTSLTTVRSNGNDLVPSYNKVKKVKKVKAEKSNTKHPLVGRKLHTSFGYDMTINDFAQILEVSPTGKTVVCQMVSKNTNGQEWGYNGSGKATPGSTLHGPKFRLKYKKTDTWESFNGSYPFCIYNDGHVSKRFGYFSLCNDGDEFYENHVD